jgi:2-haloalkanoic acid dehalogenase type II
MKLGLEALRKQGVKLAILSNGEPKMLEAAAKSAGIRDLLDDVISVDEVKIFKVRPRVYNLAPERMRVTNPELGFISANSWDINGGAAAGLNTFWIQRSPRNSGFKRARSSRRSPILHRCCAAPRCPSLTTLPLPVWLK